MPKALDGKHDAEREEINETRTEKKRDKKNKPGQDRNPVQHLVLVGLEQKYKGFGSLRNFEH